MHATPDAETEMVSQAIYGTPISIVENEGNWAYIETPDGYRGWAQKNGLLSQEAPYPTTAHIAAVDALWAHLYRCDDTPSLRHARRIYFTPPASAFGDGLRPSPH